jgi:hypothetical protein
MNKYELTIKDLTKIKFNLNKLPEDAYIHLTDKIDNTSPFSIAQTLPKNNFTISFALRNHYHMGKFDAITNELEQYLEGIKNNPNITELLIVSGSSRGVVDSLAMLEYLQSKDNKTNIGVAYNCNLDNQEEENARLVLKLKHKFVKSVYIQITDNLDQLETGIKYIRSIRKGIKIAVCMIKPSNSLLNSMKLRPWKGVKLSPEFLNNIDRAQSINNWNMRELKKADVDFLYTI